MMKTKFPIILVTVFLYFTAYLVAVFYQSTLWGDILSPAGALLSGFIILYTYSKQIKYPLLKNGWVLLLFAILSWALADILWAVYDFMGKRPENSSLIFYLYMCCNILLFGSILAYMVHKYKKWNSFQLLLDSVSIGISCVILLWIIYFNKGSHILDRLYSQGVVCFISIIFDFAILVGMIIWFFSIRCGKVPTYLKVVSASILLFILTDIYWYNLFFRNLYKPNSFIDAVYMVSLLGMGVGSGLRLYAKKSTVSDVRAKSDACFKHRGYILLLCPVLLIVIKGFELSDFLLFIFIIFINESLTVYIQGSIKNEQLLAREKELNQELESRIIQRTRELVEKNKQLDFLSNHDSVTDLYNRRCFINMLNNNLKHPGSGETMALLFIDIDRFKTINDTYGHYIGDKVLVEISKRLLKLYRNDAFIARLGGDEFVLAFQAHYGYEQAEKIAGRIIDDCLKPIIVGPYSFRITISIGISVFPFDSKSAETLMKNADIAMYQAKKQGYNKYVSFNQSIDNTIRRKNEIEILLKETDFTREFTVYYQPQFNVIDHKLTGMEALLRWNCPEKGMIYPGEFIPIAEETDIIIPLGEWVLKKAICQISDWNKKYDQNLKMGINVSPKQLDQTDYTGLLESLIYRFNVKPEWLDLEITESVAMKGEFRINEIARQFKDTGVSVSVDDFGTGYSSLSYLKLLPFDRIKIAKSLIDAVATDAYDRQIIKFIIMLAKSIGKKIIAEGVEFKEQYDILAQLNCEEIQGFYFGKPVPPEVFEDTYLKTMDIPAEFESVSETLQNNGLKANEICPCGVNETLLTPFAG